MAHYIVRRGLQSIVLTWIATLIGFTIYQLRILSQIEFKAGGEEKEAR